jgi:hypothetical protein
MWELEIMLQEARMGKKFSDSPSQPIIQPCWYASVISTMKESWAEKSRSKTGPGKISKSKKG